MDEDSYGADSNESDGDYMCSEDDVLDDDTDSGSQDDDEGEWNYDEDDSDGESGDSVCLEDDLLQNTDGAYYPRDSDGDLIVPSRRSIRRVCLRRPHYRLMDEDSSGEEEDPNALRVKGKSSYVCKSSSPVGVITNVHGLASKKPAL